MMLIYISRIIVTSILLCLIYNTNNIRGEETTNSIVKPSPVRISYSVDSRPFRMQMLQRQKINLTIFINKLDFSAPQKLDFDKVIVKFEVNTLSPQFNILGLYGNESRAVVLERKQIDIAKFYKQTQMLLVAEYIGHATIEPSVMEFYTGSKLTSTRFLTHIQDSERLHIVIVPTDTIWNLIFIISVSIFIIITYINMGAQLDIENTKKLINEPKTIILGLIITIFVMPLASWFAGQYFLSKQSLYRIGSFVFACGPAATASTLWTVLLDSDKELSIGLQVASTISAIYTMPLLLYFMDSAMSMEGPNNVVRVPYTKLIQTLVILSIALWIGYRFVGQSKKAKQISTKIFRPLTFFVLFFIIIFSSIIYYYVYVMFDWTIVLTSFVITLITYTLSGLLGYIINRDLDHSIAISISSTYKNSGIAFAVLIVAFESPDTYIAYVPCLTQVVTTSLSLYLFYGISKLVNLIRRRNQPSVINAEIPETSIEENNREGKIKKKEVRSDSIGDKSTKSDEVNSNELMTINVHDEVPGSPISQRESLSIEGTESKKPAETTAAAAAATGSEETSVVKEEIDVKID